MSVREEGQDMKQCSLDEKWQSMVLEEVHQFNREYEDRIDKIKRSSGNSTSNEKVNQIRAIRKEQFEKSNCLQHLETIKALSRTIPKRMIILERESDETVRVDIDQGDSSRLGCV